MERFISSAPAAQWQDVVQVFNQIQAIQPTYPDPDGLLPAAQRALAEETRHVLVHLVPFEQAAPRQRMDVSIDVPALGIVGLLDFLLADPGKYAEFRQRERRARERHEEEPENPPAGRDRVRCLPADQVAEAGGPVPGLLALQ